MYSLTDFIIKKLGLKDNQITYNGNMFRLLL